MSLKRYGVSFPAWQGENFIPPVDVLLGVGRWIATDIEWLIRDAEFAPGWRASDELNAMSHQVNRTPSRVLIDLLSDGVQMIGGELLAFRRGQARPFLIIRSVRGDEWDVEAEDREPLDDLRAVFEEVTDLPTG